MDRQVRERTLGYATAALVLLIGLSACQSEVPMTDQGEALTYGADIPFYEGTTPYPLTMPSAIDGAKVFTAECATCHTGAEASPDFTDPDWNWQVTPGHLFDEVSRGVAEHPAFGDHLSIVDVWDAIGYVWSLNMSDPDSLTKGALTFGENCSVCHGKTGFGNGPLAHKLDPKPQNFTNRQVMSEFTNEYMYFRISEGGQWTEIPESILQTMPKARYHAQQWSAMPTWNGVLTPAQRRLIINHLRALTIKLED